jgi:hypothetical protein
LHRFRDGRIVLDEEDPERRDRYFGIACHSADRHVSRRLTERPLRRSSSGVRRTRLTRTCIAHSECRIQFPVESITMFPDRFNAARYITIVDPILFR